MAHVGISQDGKAKGLYVEQISSERCLLERCLLGRRASNP